MRSILPWLLLPLLSACPSGGGDPDLAGRDLVADLAAADPGDLAGAGECTAPSDCARFDTPPNVRFCPSSSFSCIAGRCTWECHGGRTCALQAGGCLHCDRGQPACPTDACVGGILRGGAQIDEALCARGDLMEVAGCFGGFVRLKDGMLCTLEDLATGLQRELLACGRCQTAVVY